MAITKDGIKSLLGLIHNCAFSEADATALSEAISQLVEEEKNEINTASDGLEDLVDASGNRLLDATENPITAADAEGMTALHFVLKKYMELATKEDSHATAAARIIKGLVDAGANLETVTGTGAKFKGTDVVGKSFLVLLLEHYSAAPKLVEQVFKTLDSTTLYNKLTQDGDVKTAYEAALKALSNDNDKEVAFKAATIDLVTPPASSILTFTSSVAIAGAIMVAIFAYVYWHSYGDSNSYDEEVTDTDNGEHSSDAMMDGPSGN